MENMEEQQQYEMMYGDAVHGNAGNLGNVNNEYDAYGEEFDADMEYL